MKCIKIRLLIELCSDEFIIILNINCDNTLILISFSYVILFYANLQKELYKFFSAKHVVREKLSAIIRK